MRIFLDANVLFSAARAAGAMRELLQALLMARHELVADEYVLTEARRNLSAKASPQAVDDLASLAANIEIQALQRRPQDAHAAAALWLPEKDRPVLLAAMAARCHALVTGDRTHFGAGYGKAFEGVTIYSPAQLAQAALKPQSGW